jgi:SH3-like domain-containing protein
MISRLTRHLHVTSPYWRVLLVLFLTGVLGSLSALAQSASNPSGLALPRFATTRSEPINVRVGPGQRYDIAWVYVKAGVPVEIIQEFDTWRKIRDYEGEEGWVHQSLLSGRRAGRVVMTNPSGQIALRSDRSKQSDVRAWLPVGYAVEIDDCDGIWCAIKAKFSPKGKTVKTYKGYLPQIVLWGVYPDEKFD